MKRVFRPVNGGVLQDLPLPYLPDGSLSSGLNVRVRNETLEKSKGYASVYGTPQVAPTFVMPVVRSTSDHFWMYGDKAQMYVVDEGNTHTEITNAGGNFGGNDDDGWVGGIYGNVPVLTNNVDVPQEWATVGTGTNLTDLSNWTTDVGTSATCKVLRPFRQYLVAMNTNEGGTAYPQRVRWSDKGSASTMPTWDATDATQDAGFDELLADYEEIQDGLALRDRFIIYKTNSTYIMSFVGGSAVMGFRKQFNTSGALSSNCVGEFRNRHFALTASDVVMHDGNSIQSIIDKKNRKWLFSRIDPVAAKRSFLVVNEGQEEVWVCFPEDGESYASLALIYSLQNGTWGVRELPGVRHAAVGQIEQTAGSWDSDTDSWDTDSERWDETQYSPAEERMVWAGTSDTKLYEADKGNTADGTAFRANATRESDPFGDTDQVIRVNRVRPIVNALDGTAFTIRLGTQMKLDDAIDYTEYTFTYGTDEQVNVRETGKYISWEVETEADTDWQLHGVEFEFQEMGRR